VTSKKALLLLVVFGCFWFLPKSNAQTLGIKLIANDYNSSLTSDASGASGLAIGGALSYQHKLNEFFEVDASINIGSSIHHPIENSDQKDTLQGSYGGFDIGLRFVPEVNWPIKPYAFAQLGYVRYNEAFTSSIKSDDLQIPVGLGLVVPLAKKLNLDISAAYRVSTTRKVDAMHYGLGLQYVFGKNQPKAEKPTAVDYADRDGDGVADVDDACPDERGTLNGCPDSDKDGVIDSRDACPDKQGLKRFSGCPDSDNDGLGDNEDECPNEPGTRGMNGCPDPDADQDGIPDSLDDCPNVKGERQFDGCPDSDGDGIQDRLDKCPNKAGTIENEGCPKGVQITFEDKAILQHAMYAIKFKGSDLLPTSNSILIQVAGVIKKYPTHQVEIAGHTDNIGDAKANKTLSERRANAVFNYLKLQGIPTRQMNVKGYGEEFPIADNSTRDGRKKNKRIEINLYQ